MTDKQIALPERLVRRASTLGISEHRLEGLTILLVQTYLDAQDSTRDSTADPLADASTFARQMITANRPLFEELAQS